MSSKAQGEVQVGVKQLSPEELQNIVDMHDDLLGILKKTAKVASKYNDLGTDDGFELVVEDKHNWYNWLTGELEYARNMRAQQASHQDSPQNVQSVPTDDASASIENAASTEETVTIEVTVTIKGTALTKEAEQTDEAEQVKPKLTKKD